MREAVKSFFKPIIVDRKEVAGAIRCGEGIDLPSVVGDELHVFEFIRISTGSHEKHVFTKMGHPWVLLGIVPGTRFDSDPCS